MITAPTPLPPTEKVIPMLPCPDIRTQVAFYKALGFEVLGLYTSPNPYAAVKWKSIELHFWGKRSMVAAQNTAMCFIMVNDVDAVNEAFTNALKQHYGKIPRNGLPKITQVRNLAYDRRFTLTDPGGNTFYIGSPATEADRFFRQLNNPDDAKLFAALYDVVYSKEDPALADSMLPKYTAIGNQLEGLDKAKYLLLLLDIQKHLGRSLTAEPLAALIAQPGNDDESWQRIKKKYREILDQ
jgi:hypothetical protein